MRKIVLLKLFITLMVTNIPFLVADPGQVGLETVSQNGSTYFKAWNQGTIEPVTWLNASTGNAQVANGDTFNEAEQRFKWVLFTYGLVRLNGNNLTAVTDSNLRHFNTYGYSDNSTYWRTEANRSFTLGGKETVLRLKHSQQLADDYVNYVFEANTTGTYTSLFDIWLAVGLTRININTDDDVDHLAYVFRNNSNALYTMDLNASEPVILSNVSFLKVEDFDSAKAWDFVLPPDGENAVAVVPIAGKQNADVYVLFKIGRTLSGGFTREWQAIDAGCNVGCSYGTSLVIEFDWAKAYQPRNSSAAVPINFTASARVTASGPGSCSYGNGCTLSFQFLNPTKTDEVGDCIYLDQVTDVQGGTGNWTSCADPSWGSNNCTQVTGGRKTPNVVNPTIHYWYDWKGVQQATYADTLSCGFTQSLQAKFGPTPGYIYAYDEANGTDWTAPYVSIENVLNNTVVNVTSTNGSLEYANFTALLGFNDTGFVKGSQKGVWWNASGSLVLTVLPSGQDNFTNLTNHRVEVRNGSYYTMCVGANSTSSYSGARYDNWTTNGIPNVCYVFGVNIVPSGPVPVVNLSTPSNGTLFVNMSSVNFTCNASGAYNLDKVELWGNWNGGWHANQSLDFDNNLTFTHTFNSLVEDGYFEWNCKFVDVYGLSAFVNQNWTFGMENQSRWEIEKGIRNVTPNASVLTNQQVYVVNENGAHYLGRFDKESSLGNQTWAFNYVTTPLEAFVGMPSLKTAVNVWENQTLSLQQIFDQVTTFISSTLFS